MNLGFTIPEQALTDIKTREMLEEAIAFASARPVAWQALKNFVLTSKSKRDGVEKNAAVSSNPAPPSERLIKALSDPMEKEMMIQLLAFASTPRGRISLKQFLNRAAYRLHVDLDPGHKIYEISNAKEGYEVFGIDDPDKLIQAVSKELVRYKNSYSKYSLERAEKHSDFHVRYLARIAGQLAKLADQEKITLQDLISGRLNRWLLTEAHQGFQSMRAAAEEHPRLFSKDITALTADDLDFISDLPKVGPRTFQEIVVFKTLVEETDHFRKIAFPLPKIDKMPVGTLYVC